VRDCFNLSRRAFGVLAVAILTSGIATADTIVASVDPTLGEYGVWISINGVDTDLYFAGGLDIQLTNSNGTVTRETMCVDLFTDIYVGEAYGTSVDLPSQVVPPQNAALLERVAWLEDNALLPALTPGAPSVLPSSDWVEAPNAPAMGAGMQLAIWDIVVDGGDGFSQGVVQQGSAANPTDPTVLYWAETYEALSAGQSSDLGFVYENVNLSDGSPAQTLEGPEFQDNGPQPAPESPTFVLAGMALLALTHTARRKLASR
jgi:hypothetical protein